MNRDDFETSLAPILDPAFRLAMTMSNDRTAAEDAVQEAALKAWRNLGNLRWGSPLRPWFLAIVANECRTARRTRWWRVIRVAELLPRRASRDLSAERIDLEAALDRLPRHHLLSYPSTTTWTCRCLRSRRSLGAPRPPSASASTAR